MKSYIESRIENLRKMLSWKEAGCELSRLNLIEQAKKYTAEEIAHRSLSSLNDICREVEEIKSLRDQIDLLEHILKNSEQGGESCE